MARKYGATPKVNGGKIAKGSLNPEKPIPVTSPPKIIAIIYFSKSPFIKYGTIRATITKSNKLPVQLP